MHAVVSRSQIVDDVLDHTPIGRRKFSAECKGEEVFGERPRKSPFVAEKDLLEFIDIVESVNSE